MPQLIAGNWKMHCCAPPAADAGHAACAPAPRAWPAICWSARRSPRSSRWPGTGRIRRSRLAARTATPGEQGAHTGDVSAAMLRDAGATWVILGHSERRQNHGETDELVREKVLAAVEAGLTPIVCVGETEDQRTSAARRPRWSAGSSPAACPKPFTGVVAYEPVWAIGTGKTATEQDVATMHAFIREELVRQFGDAGQGIRILYGGSMRPANAGVAARGAACRRRADRRRQPEGGGLPGDCPGSAGQLVGAHKSFSPSPCGRGLGEGRAIWRAPPPAPSRKGRGRMW